MLDDILTDAKPPMVSMTNSKVK